MVFAAETRDCRARSPALAAADPYAVVCLSGGDEATVAASRLWPSPARILPSGCSRRAGRSPSYAHERFRVAPARPRPGTPRRLAAPSVFLIESDAQPAASRSASSVAEGGWWHSVQAGSRFRSSWWGLGPRPAFPQGRSREACQGCAVLRSARTNAQWMWLPRTISAGRVHSAGSIRSSLVLRTA